MFRSPLLVLALLVVLTSTGCDRSQPQKASAAESSPARARAGKASAGDEADQARPRVGVELSTVKGVSIQRMSAGSDARPITSTLQWFEAEGVSFGDMLWASGPNKAFLVTENLLPQGLYHVRIDATGLEPDDAMTWFARAMLQDFGLWVTIGNVKDMAGYTLSPASAASLADPAAGGDDTGTITATPGGASFRNVTLAQCAAWLERRLDAPIVADSDAAGRVSFDLYGDRHGDLGNAAWLSDALAAHGLSLRSGTVQRRIYKVVYGPRITKPQWSR